MSESSAVDAAFDRSRERFESVVGFLHGSQAAGLTHSELETRLSVDARELIRVLYQDHLDLRTAREVRLPVLTDAAGICRGAVERGHRRPLFGAVNVDRLAYRHRGEAKPVSSRRGVEPPDRGPLPRATRARRRRIGTGQLRRCEVGAAANDRCRDRETPGRAAGGPGCGGLRGLLRAAWPAPPPMTVMCWPCPRTVRGS